MYVAPEIITIFFIVSFLIYTMPMVLVKFSKTLKGRFLLVLLMIVVTLYNKLGGIMIALLIIFLSEFNYEINNQVIFEGFEGEEGEEGKEGEEGDATIIDQMTIREQIKPKSASSQIVVNMKNDNNDNNDNNNN